MFIASLTCMYLISIKFVFNIILLCVGEMSAGEMSVTIFLRNVCQRNVLSAKCLSAKYLSAEKSVCEIS